MAILALSQFTVRTDEIVTFLADLLDEGSLDPTSAAQVPIALGRLGEPARKTLPQLLRLGAGRRTHVRIAESCVLAIGRLATFEDAEAWTFLTETVQWGTNEQARHFALVALAEIAARAAADGAEGRRERFGETVAFLRQEFERPKSKPHQ